jgi:hypothetical protein
METSQKCIRLMMWVALLAASSLAIADAPVNDQQLVQFFRKTWKAQKSEVLTAHVTCRLMRRALENKPDNINPDQLEELIRTSDFISRPNDIYNFAAKIGLKLDGKKPAWGNLDITYNSGRTRERFEYDGRLISEQSSDGDNDVRVDGLNRQIDILPFRASRIKMTGIEGLRFIPTISESEQLTVLKRSGNGLVVISLPLREFLVEEKTALVRRAVDERYDNGIRREIIQVGSLALPGGIIFPESVVEAQFSKGSLIMISITVIDSIDLNQNVNADAFQIAANKDDRVFDYRQDRKNPEYVQVSKPVPNLIAFVNQNSAPRVEAIDERSKNSNPGLIRWLIVGGTAVAFFILLSFLIYRRLTAVRLSTLPPGEP